jgi:hypothetical protein
VFVRRWSSPQAARCTPGLFVMAAMSCFSCASGSRLILNFEFHHFRASSVLIASSKIVPSTFTVPGSSDRMANTALLDLPKVTVSVFV